MPLFTNLFLLWAFILVLARCPFLWFAILLRKGLTFRAFRWGIGDVCFALRRGLAVAFVLLTLRFFFRGLERVLVLCLLDAALFGRAVPLFAFLRRRCAPTLYGPRAT
jgi:hypothetical protein